MKRSTEETLREARTHFELMSRHAQGDLTDQLVIDAICMRLSAGIEALGRLDSARRDQLFGDAWPIMWGMRTRIAHGYLLVGADTVRLGAVHRGVSTTLLAEREVDDTAYPLLGCGGSGDEHQVVDGSRHRQ